MMPSSLPSESILNRIVQDFGIGPYDSISDLDKGENDSFDAHSDRALPNDNGDESNPLEYYLGYPTPNDSSDRVSTGLSLPGDFDRPPVHRKRSPESNVFQSRTSPSDVTLTGTKALPERDSVHNKDSLPVEEDNPAARSDYYDTMHYGAGMKSVKDIFSDGGDSYASSEIPNGSEENDIPFDRGLGGLGNAWSGYSYQDQSVPVGHPNNNFTEEVDFLQERPNVPDKGKIQPFGYDVVASRMRNHKKVATNFEVVIPLTKEFLSEYGKKNLTKRAVLEFLQNRNLPQYLSSDVIRCAFHKHNVVIADVLDQFPIIVALKKVASMIKSIKAAGRVVPKNLHIAAHNLRVAVRMIEDVNGR